MNSEEISRKRVKEIEIEPLQAYSNFKLYFVVLVDDANYYDVQIKGYLDFFYISCVNINN